MFTDCRGRLISLRAPPLGVHDMRLVSLRAPPLGVHDLRLVPVFVGDIGDPQAPPVREVRVVAEMRCCSDYEIIRKITIALGDRILGVMDNCVY